MVLGCLMFNRNQKKKKTKKVLEVVLSLDDANFTPMKEIFSVLLLSVRVLTAKLQIRTDPKFFKMAPTSLL